MDKLNKKPTNTLAIKDVCHFLQTTPNFFVDYPELLDKLNIPHLPGQAVASLIEYQNRRLKQQNSELANKLSEYQRDSQAHSHLFDDIGPVFHALGCARNCTDIYQTLEYSLITNFSADYFRLFIFGQNFPKCRRKGIYYLPSGDHLQVMFCSLFNSNQTLCDSLQDEHKQTLFAVNPWQIKSTLLQTLCSDEWSALLVLGANSPDVYRLSPQLEMFKLFCTELLCSLERQDLAAEVI